MTVVSPPTTPVVGLSESDRGIVLDMGESRLQGTGAELLESEEVAELYTGS